MNLGNSGTVAGDTLSQTIVEAVAETEGIAPEALTPPLYDVVDPEALGNLFTATGRNRRSAGGRVRFTYHGHDVTVWADGEVDVDAPACE